MKEEVVPFEEELPKYEWSESEYPEQPEVGEEVTVTPIPCDNFREYEHEGKVSIVIHPWASVYMAKRVASEFFVKGFEGAGIFRKIESGTMELRPPDAGVHSSIASEFSIT